MESWLDLSPLDVGSDKGTRYHPTCSSYMLKDYPHSLVKQKVQKVEETYIVGRSLEVLPSISCWFYYVLFVNRNQDNNKRCIKYIRKISR